MNNLINFPNQAPDALCVGRRVYCGLHGGRDGVITKVDGTPSPGSIRSHLSGCILSGGTAFVDVAFLPQGEDRPAYLSRSVPESVVSGVQWDIRPEIAPAAFLEKLLLQIEANEKHEAAVNERAAAIRADATRRGQAFLASRIPSWATHAIVAEHQHNDSDSQTDYFASHTDSTLLLAFSKHGRNLFAEMRNAASHAPETAHLGPECDIYSVHLVWNHDWNDEAARGDRWLSTDEHYYKGYGLPIHFWSDFLPQSWRDLGEYSRPRFLRQCEADAFVTQLPPMGGCTWKIEKESVEHRETYSMGHGYYLGTGRHSGWQVSKIHLGARDLSHAVGMGGYRIPEKPDTLPSLEAAPRFPPVPPPPVISLEDPRDVPTHRTEPVIPARLRDRRAKAEAAIRNL